MTTWHRTDDHGIPVQFGYEPDARGNVTLTVQELEGLMRTGGWKTGPIPKYATGGFTGPPVADMTPRPLWGGVVVVPEAGRDYTALLEAINNDPIPKETP